MKGQRQYDLKAVKGMTGVAQMALRGDYEIKMNSKWPPVDEGRC
jgi:hypothetical protein